MNHFNMTKENAVGRESPRTLSAREGLTLFVDDLHVLDHQTPLPALVLTDAALERRLVLHVNNLRGGKWIVDQEK
jgi:hypothetical protein